MKKVLIVALSLVLLVAVVAPAMAAGGPPSGSGQGQGRRGVFTLTGTITGIDPVARTVTVSVVAGNPLVQPYIGQNLTLVTTTTTRFLLRNPDGTATPITFEDLAIGQNVSGQGNLAGGVWTASRITVGAPLVHQP